MSRQLTAPAPAEGDGTRSALAELTSRLLDDYLEGRDAASLARRAGALLVRRHPDLALRIECGGAVLFASGPTGEGAQCSVFGIEPAPAVRILWAPAQSSDSEGLRRAAELLSAVLAHARKRPGPG